MTDITSIPYNDIVDYLRLNNQRIPTNRDVAYQLAENLIYSGQASEAPLSVTDWILAYNLQANKVTFPTYDALNIIMTPDNELVSLSQKLLLPEVDKERIIRILGYLGFSNNVFDQLPV